MYAETKTPLSQNARPIFFQPASDDCCPASAPAIANMPIQLTTAKQANTSTDVTEKGTATISVTVVPAEKTHGTVVETRSQQRTALTSSQIHALVCSAFDSASTQLHTPSEEGMQIRFLMALYYFRRSSYHSLFLLLFFLFLAFRFFSSFFIASFIFPLPLLPLLPLIFVISYYFFALLFFL